MNFVFQFKNTPKPGAYEARTFLEELMAEPVSKSYGFKSEGRRRNADPSRKGHYLMPGLYERHDNISDELSRRKKTYNFKSVDRNNTTSVVTGMMDKVSQISHTWFPGFQKPHFAILLLFWIVF